MRISTPASPGRGGNRVRDRAGAAAGQSPRPERAVDLAHVVVEQDVRRARRTHAQERADDAAGRHRRLEHVGLEPLVEKVRRAHRHELHLVVAIGTRQVAEAPAQERQPRQLPRVERPRVWRRHVEDGLHEARHLDHRPAVLVVGLRVHSRVPGDLAKCAGVVVHAPEVIAAGHRRERAVKRQDLQAVPRQVELADDLGPQQRHDVRAHREPEAGDDLLGDCRAAEHVPPLEDEHLSARAGHVGGVHEPVVPAAEDDAVVHWAKFYCRLQIDDCRLRTAQIGSAPGAGVHPSGP